MTGFAPFTQLGNRCQLCVCFFTPKSAVKSGRRARRIFSNNTISLARRTYTQMKVLDPFIHTSFSNTHSYDKDCILCTVTDKGLGRWEPHPQGFGSGVLPGSGSVFLISLDPDFKLLWIRISNFSGSGSGFSPRIPEQNKSAERALKVIY